MSAGDLQSLVRTLQSAYSGELAAAYAYRGHWRSVRDAREREQIHVIENEEWHHRQLVGGMLHDLGAEPRQLRETIFWMIGQTLGRLCRVSGWFLPMYGAGRLERRNFVEYEDAAAFAVGCGREDLVDCLLTMAEVEWEHEQYFRSKVTGHPMLRLLKIWEPAPPKESIRARYKQPMEPMGRTA